MASPILISFLAFDLVGALILVLGRLNRAEGYEDELGFHEGETPALKAAPEFLTHVSVEDVDHPMSTRAFRRSAKARHPALI
jgi:hypothetical protein